MYTIDLEVAARFQGATPAAVGGADAFWSFLQNGIGMVVAATYHIVGTQARAQRRFRICVGDEILAIRRQTAATGVGQTIEAVFSLAIEREL